MNTNRGCARPPVVRRIRAGIAARRQANLERPHRLAFQRFYETLNSHHNPYYMFFTEGLLHWAMKTLEFVPADVNVVLIGANLTRDEVAYLSARAGRPFHVIDARVSDTAVWEWLFEVNEGNFGWLDVDCLVLNPQLFRSMSSIAPDVALNGCWRTYQGWSFLATYFLFINHRALCDVKARVPGISPRIYAPWWDERVYIGVARMLGASDRLVARRLGSPKVFFDTTQLYQMAAMACGYALQPVRDLQNDPEFRNFCSSELLHVTGISWYRHHYLKSDTPFTHDLVMRAITDYLLLDRSDPQLPASYAQAKSHIVRMLGGDPRALRGVVHRYLCARGFSESILLAPGLDFLDYEPARQPDLAHVAQ